MGSGIDGDDWGDSAPYEMPRDPLTKVHGPPVHEEYESLHQYVSKHAIRGECTCGRCCDAPVNPEKLQPQDGRDARHVVDLTFFKVGSDGKATKEEFESRVLVQYPKWLDGKEHSYLEVGADMGDQGTALMTIALGHILGVWKCLCPETVMPDLPKEMKLRMAENGLVCLQKCK